MVCHVHCYVYYKWCAMLIAMCITNGVPCSLLYILQMVCHVHCNVYYKWWAVFIAMYITNGVPCSLLYILQMVCYVQTPGAVNLNQQWTMASETVDPIDWSHFHPHGQHPLSASYRCSLSSTGNRSCNFSMWGNHLACAAAQGMISFHSGYEYYFHSDLDMWFLLQPSAHYRLTESAPATSAAALVTLLSHPPISWQTSVPTWTVITPITIAQPVMTTVSYIQAALSTPCLSTYTCGLPSEPSQAHLRVQVTSRVPSNQLGSVRPIFST